MTRWVVFVSLCVGVGASQRIPLTVLAWNPHKGLAREISHETGRGRGKEVKRRRRTEKSTGECSQQKSEEPTARMCGLRRRAGQRERMSQRSWGLRGNFAWIHARGSSQNFREVSQTSPFLRLELTPVRICMFSFLPPSRLCMLCFVCP